ncbi:MAG: DUF1385 domain-containing protein [Chloroflexi bacterium]|nr:DUF1385 domain-containing protein [Chloroflexota bacterium]
MAQQFFYGGQAVIEGVMIRGQRNYSVAARDPDGQICTISNPIPSMYSGRLRRVPFVRGTLVLLETLIVGMTALTYSARVAAGEEAQAYLGKFAMVGMIAVSLGIGIALFFLAPLLIVESAVDRFTDSSIISNLSEGLIRLAIFMVYLKLIGLMPDIRRVFAYHAAEHMAVHAHEAKLALNTENVRKFQAAHPRCGTAFLLTVMFVSILVFALLGTPDLPLRIASRIVLIPVIAGISYEIIRFSGVHEHNPLVKLVVYPSMALQAMTTRPPEDDMIEVAIAAMETAIASDEASALGQDGAPTTTPA